MAIFFLRPIALIQLITWASKCQPRNGGEKNLEPVILLWLEKLNSDNQMKMHPLFIPNNNNEQRENKLIFFPASCHRLSRSSCLYATLFFIFTSFFSWKNFFLDRKELHYIFKHTFLSLKDFIHWYTTHTGKRRERERKKSV